jgi:hypothetical protein
MARMDWNKNRKYSVREEKYEPGSILENGRVVVGPTRDDLAKRAGWAEQKWLKQMGMNSLQDSPKQAKQPRKKKWSKKPTKGQQVRLRMIRGQLEPRR